MNKIASTACLGVFAAFTLCCYAGKISSFPDGSRVAFFGDSITRNGGGILRVAAHYKNAFPDRNVRFYNVGISGGGLAAAEMYFDSMLAARKPTHVILAFGVNDSGAPEGFHERYAALVGRIEALGAKVVLRAPTPYNEFGGGTVSAVSGKDAAHRRIADEIRAFAKERGLQFLDDYGKMKKCLADGEDVFNGDRVHPNDLGQWRMAETLLSAQGLTIEPYRPRSEVAASSGLAQWEAVSQKIANLNSAEWLVVRDESLDVPAKIAKVGEWLSTKGAKPGANQFVVRIAKDYLRDKPQESVLYAELDNAK